MTSLSLVNPTLSTDDLDLTISTTGKDGNCGSISKEDELHLRILGSKFIKSSGPLLRLSQVTISTAQVLFQRFYYQRSLKIFSILDICMACTFCACKVEESCRRLRDIVNVFDYLHRKYRNLPTDPMPYVCSDYYDYKDSLVEAEMIVLRELGFNVHVQHAHGLLINYLKALDLNENLYFCQKALNYLNDMFMTDAFVRFQPNVIACACIFMASWEKEHYLVDESIPWWEVFDASLGDMKILASNLLFAYQVKIRTELPVNHQELDVYYPL